MSGFLCALCCELHLLLSLGCFAGLKWSSSLPGFPQQFTEQEPSALPAELEAHPDSSFLQPTQELIEDLKADHKFGNSCRKFIPLLEAA